MRVKQTFRRIFIVMAMMLAVPGISYAAQSASTNYQVNEVFFGAGGALKDCSANYCAKESAGETAVGNPSSPNYQAHAGFNTDRTPFLQFIVNGTNTNIGVLSTGATSTTTATFSVKNYLSSGYQVVTVSNPPKNNAYGMHNLTTPTAANPGHEQFGMNLVKNQTCGGLSGDVGENPIQVPDSNFSYGKVVAGYDTPCQFKYVPGNPVAYSDSSSGETDYTISYIYNISNITPGGTYDFNDILVATATF